MLGFVVLVILYVDDINIFGVILNVEGVWNVFV